MAYDDWGKDYSRDLRAFAGQQQSNARVEQNLPPEGPLMDMAIKGAHESLAELAASVDWLIQKIQPVCQPQPITEGKSGETGQQIQASPSALRSEFVNIKLMAESMSRRISSVRYTIEI